LKNYLMICLVAYLCSLYSSPVFASYARAYANAPKGSHICQFHSISSSSSTDDEDSLENRKTEMNIYTPLYIFTFEGLNERAGGIGFTFPLVDYFSYDKGAGTVLEDETGLGDLTLLFDHNFYGGKSMEAEEFARTKPGTYGGIHFALTLPIGDYSSSKGVNIGSNRCELKTTYQHSIALNDSATWLEFYGSVKIFGDNDKYLGGNELSQDPLFGLDVYLSHDVTPTVWLETGLIYTNGGAISINGTEQVEKQSVLNVQLGFRAPMWRKASIRFFYAPTLYDNRDGFVKGYAVRTMFQQVF
jgi:outer membrane putative beta-barrel porin/alpha-amylase